MNSVLEEFLKECDDFIENYKERITQIKGSRRWSILTKRLFDKMFRIDVIINKGLEMNFIEASENTRNGKVVRRKNWDEGTKMWWDAGEKCMLANTPYGKQDKHLKTNGYIYVCEGDDVEAGDWELVK